jgi:DnaK suppressor protein
MKTPVKAAKKAPTTKKPVAAKKVVAKPVKKVVAVKKSATQTKVAAPAKKIVTTKNSTPKQKPVKPVKTALLKDTSIKAVTPKAVSSVPPTPAASVTPLIKPAKARKGADKNYVAPPTVVLVQTSAKLVHTPSGLGQILNPAVIPAPVKKNAKLATNWKSKKPHELSDAEVIAMPDEEYMNKTQLAFFKFKLTELQNSILKSASETTEHMRDDSAVVPDPTDRATIEEEHALELRTRDRERKLLKKIQQSLARIEQEDYGYCDETGEPIGVSRLIARPTASLSLEAQQRRELKQKMFGD